MDEYLFKDIGEQEQEKMFACFGSVRRKYAKGETIAHMDGQFRRIGILMSGKAHIACIDFEGQISLIEQLEPGGVFGDLFSLPMDNFAFLALADTECEVRYLDYQSIVRPCDNVCQYHCRLINNLFHMTAFKSRRLALHINVLSRRTTRQKLITYFEMSSMLNGTPEFSLPFSYTALADYLGVDRSAMMRELKRIKEEGIVRISGRTVTFIGE